MTRKLKRWFYYAMHTCCVTRPQQELKKGIMHHPLALGVPVDYVRLRSWFLPFIIIPFSVVFHYPRPSGRPLVAIGN